MKTTRGANHIKYVKFNEILSIFSKVLFLKKVFRFIKSFRRPNYPGLNYLESLLCYSIGLFAFQQLHCNASDVYFLLKPAVHNSAQAGKSNSIIPHFSLFSGCQGQDRDLLHITVALAAARHVICIEGWMDDPQGRNHREAPKAHLDFNMTRKQAGSGGLFLGPRGWKVYQYGTNSHKGQTYVRTDRQTYVLTDKMTRPITKSIHAIVCGPISVQILLKHPHWPGDSKYLLRF